MCNIFKICFSILNLFTPQKSEFALNFIRLLAVRNIIALRRIQFVFNVVVKHIFFVIKFIKFK